MTLPDGRKLGYAQYGSPTGKPIFYLHGFPGSRLEAALWDEQAKKLHARIISVDRPGYGWSSPQPDRTLSDHPKDVQKLAEELRVKEFGVMVWYSQNPGSHPCRKIPTNIFGREPQAAAPTSSPAASQSHLPTSKQQPTSAASVSQI